MSMGHNPYTITSANAVLMIRCKGVYDTAVAIHGFQADNAWGWGDANIAETRMGVDGKQSIGYTPHETPLTLYLEANSPSKKIMENIRADFNKNMEVRYIEIWVELNSTKERYYGKGTMVKMTGGSSGKKTLEGTSYDFNLVVNAAEEIN